MDKSIKKIQGSPYLFDNWDTNSKVYIEDAVYKLTSVNFNVEHDRFEVKFEEDSVLIINPLIIKRAEINKKMFIPMKNENDSGITFFEELVSMKNFILLKHYYVKIKEGVLNPMTQQQIKPDKYIKYEDYFLKINDHEVEPIKLNKSSILKLIDDKFKDKVKNYAKQQKINYKNESELKNVLEYYNSLLNEP